MHGSGCSASGNKSVQNRVFGEILFSRGMVLGKHKSDMS